MIIENYDKKFTGRKYEFEMLDTQHKKKNASLIIVYGRRRVGKTRLITEYYHDKNLWRFDGIENGSKKLQIDNAIQQLATYTKKDIYKSMKCSGWIEFFKILDGVIKENSIKYRRTICLDEFQYMAHGKLEIVSALKWAWDNLWSDKNEFTIVLCGSVASFMVKRVIKSTSLYGRINLEICLKPFSIPEVADFFQEKKSIREICDLYMMLGGIPEYLLKINPNESLYSNIARLAFCRSGYFIHEFDKIFKDVFREEIIYKKIILALSKYKSLKALELAKILNVSSGGGFIELLHNLELAGFVKSIKPWEKSNDSRLLRFRLDDEYLLFYFKFIYHNLKKIEYNTDINYGISLFKGNQYKIWAGFAFERLCLKHIEVIKKYLKIDQLVKEEGPYFNRASNNKEAVQVDLLFIRHDPVITLCEMKYYDGLIGKWIIKEVEKKVSLIGTTKKSIERILITTNGITEDLKNTNYFSRVVLIDELFS